MSAPILLFVLIGPPNGGKGTQARFMSSAYKLLPLSSSDLIKEHSNSPENQEAIRSGKLIDDNTVNNLIKDAIQSNIEKKQGMIIDGHPRNLYQAEFLDYIISGFDVKGHNIDMLILYINVGKQELLERAKYRIICDGKTESLKKISSDSVFNITTVFKNKSYEFSFNTGNYSHPFGHNNKNNIDFENTFLVEAADKYLNNIICYKRRDDSPETSNKRINDFFINNNAIMHYFKVTSSYGPKIIEINGNQSPDKVFQDIQQELSARGIYDIHHQYDEL